MSQPYESRQHWRETSPEALVIACSDGRLQQSVDEFVQDHLGITDYDRVYMPGGPGALATSGGDYLRSEQFRRESTFLVGAHNIQEVILIFHGPAANGPCGATCADYRRKMPEESETAIAEQQKNDAQEILRFGFGWKPQLRIRIYRAEVTAEGSVQFIDLS